MKKCALMILGLLILNGCSHYKWMAVIKNGKKQDTIKNVTIMQDFPPNHFFVVNNNDYPIKISYNDSSLINEHSNSVRVVAGETKKILSQLGSPDLVVPPHSRSKFNFYNPEDPEISYKYISANIAIKIHEKIFYYQHPNASKFFVTTIKDSDKKWCYATAIFYGGYCWFISPDAKETENARDYVRSNYSISDSEFSLEYMGKK